MEKFTIHRALSELKTMGARIEKQIAELQVSGIVQKDKLIAAIYKREEFEANTKASFQSITDLIERRNKIKSAIVASNAVTKVTIAKVDMTVAEAINQKAVIDYRKKLIARLRTGIIFSKSQLEQTNTKVESDAIHLAEVALGKQNVKLGDDDVVKVTGQFLEVYRYSLVDPLDAEKKIKQMEEELQAFETEVDAVLSETNAVTSIEI